MYCLELSESYNCIQVQSNRWLGLAIYYTYVCSSTYSSTLWLNLDGAGCFVRLETKIDASPRLSCQTHWTTSSHFEEHINNNKPERIVTLAKLPANTYCTPRTITRCGSLRSRSRSPTPTCIVLYVYILRSISQRATECLPFSRPSQRRRRIAKINDFRMLNRRDVVKIKMCVSSNWIRIWITNRFFLHLRKNCATPIFERMYSLQKVI